MTFLILFAPNTTLASIVMPVKYRQMSMFCVPTEGVYLMHDLAPFHKSKRTRTFLECNEIHILKKPGNLPEVYSIENVRNILKKDNGSQLPCLKEEM